MNPQQNALNVPSSDDGDEFNFAEYIDIVIDNRWLIICLTSIALALGAAYALFSSPIYEADVLLQVEDSDKSAGSFLGDTTASLFDVKTPAAGEIEIIRSRMILGQAVENTKLYIDASPKYIPLIGRWLAKRSVGLSEPGFLGFGGFVSGREKIEVPQFEVPAELEGSAFTLTVLENGSYTLSHPELADQLSGKVGQLMRFAVPDVGNVSVLVRSVDARTGAQFRLLRYSKQLVLNALQDDIRVVEKGKQSGVLNVSWQNKDPVQLTLLLNEVGRLYVRQNIERKAAEAEKTLGFLGEQLPQFKQQLERSEDVYNRYRNENGTVSLDDEAKNALTQIVDLQSKLLETQQKRRDLLSRFTEKHPAVQTTDSQIAALNAQILGVNASIKKMPLLQQDTLRMQRDVKVNTDLYVSLLNSTLQMNLAKEGKVGNVRLLDEAIAPELPIKPKRSVVMILALALGLACGIVLAMLRSKFFGGIKDPNEIEAHTGLNVYSSVPLSLAQVEIDKAINARLPGIHLLSVAHPEDAATESIRSLRTALQFAMLEAHNNRVVITGATPGVGKSFISANFSAIVAASGKRVLLVDADLRKGYINSVFAKPRALGLSEIISGAGSVEQCIHKSVIPNLDLITTGILPPNPAELLMSESFSKLLDELSSRYDLVIIDTAPILVASDTMAIAPHVGTVLLVARAEKTHLGELNESAKRLAHVGCSPNGVILNAMDLSRRYYGSYGYKYGGYKYTQYKYQNNQEI